MEVICDPKKFVETIRRLKQGGAGIGFVPTMGFLHRGHLSLLEAARRENSCVVLSIFINPLQFGAGEDLATYPVDIDNDLAKARAAGCDLVFIPGPELLYPAGFSTYVEVRGFSEKLCGASRPGHFCGVTTVVNKLFNLVRPAKAYFGQKDAQQALIIKKMATDLNMDLEIVICPTVREEDGLAMSSRNSYLSPAERKAATVLYRSLKKGESSIIEGERDAAAVAAAISDTIEQEPLARIDYVAVVDANDLRYLSSLSGTVLLAVAVVIGRARLIDNMLVNIS